MRIQSLTNVPVLALASTLCAVDAAAQESERGWPPAGDDHRQCSTILRPTTTPAPPPSGGPLDITPTFDPNVTAAQQAVIEQAIAEWEAIVEVAGKITNPYPITFQNGPLGGSLLAVASTWFSTGSGTLLNCTITFDDDGSSTWWVDGSPENDWEFAPSGACADPAGTGCHTGTDLLTVARHEIGHSLGWIGMPHPLVDPLVVGSTFDGARLNIDLGGTANDHTSSVAFPGDLMNTTIGVAERRPISLYPDVSFVARAFDHFVPLRFVDASHVGTQAGTANLPWSTLTAALAFEPPSIPMLLIPGAYEEIPTLSPEILLDTPRTFLAARGSGATIQ